MFMKNGIVAAALVGALSLQASAATCTVDGTVVFSATQGNPDAIQSAACFSGNNNNTINSGFSVFGNTGWVLAGDSGDLSGDQSLAFGSSTPAPGQTLWSLLNPSGFSQIFITFKQANFFGAFLLDPTKALSGTWGTAGPGRSINDLSHASVYYRGTPSPVPLPAGGVLLAGGLMALFGLRRNRKAA